jgi:hypothetical protein
MATAASARGTGIGRALLEFADGALVAATGIRGLWCNARVESIGSTSGWAGTWCRTSSTSPASGHTG